MIYDCFTFFNELDILEIRLNELNEVVDKFVIVEATRTHQGKKKPLYFLENRDRFRNFQEKIIHIIVDDLISEPQDRTGYDFWSLFWFEGKSPWMNEGIQRNAILKGLADCNSDDIVIISDADEIPNPEKVLEYKNFQGLRIFKQVLFCYYLNLKSTVNWYGSIMLSFEDLLNFQEPNLLRKITHNLVNINKPIDRLKLLMKGLIISLKKRRFFKQMLLTPEIHIVENGGWHFSYMGGVDKVIHKLESFAHFELNTELYKNPEYIKSMLLQYKNPINGSRLERVNIDMTFPKYIQKNINKFSHMILS
ncbi:MAG: hypothetical protein ABDH19_01510 [Thermodesulfovibrio sp.]